MSTTSQLPLAPPEWEGVSRPRRALWRTEGVLMRHRDLFFVLIFIALAVTVRLFVERGLWLDEATSVAQARMDFSRMLSYMRTSDVHPPLFQILLWLDIRLLGTSELAVRLPSLIIGTALVPALYGAGRDLFDRRAGLFAALIGAIGPAAVWYSQEARMYPMFMLFSLIAVWSQVRCVRNGTKWSWIAYVLSSAALMWTHYFSVLQVGSQQLVFLYLMWTERKSPTGKKLFAGWWRSTFAIALMVAPLLTIPYGQIFKYGMRHTETTVQSTASLQPDAPIYNAMSSLASAMLGYHSTSTMVNINALWPFAMLGALMALGRGRTRAALLLVFVSVVPMAVLFIVGYNRNDVFELRYFAGVVPAMALISGRALSILTHNFKTTLVAVLGLLLVLGIALTDEQLDGGNARTFDYRGALSEVYASHQAGDKLYYEPFYLHPTVHYYAPDMDSYPLIAGIQSTTEPKRIILVDSLSFADRDRSKERVSKVIDRLKKDRKLVQHIQRNKIEVWIFE